MMEEIKKLPEVVLHLPNSSFEKRLEEEKQEGIAEGRREGVQKRNREIASH